MTPQHRLPRRRDLSKDPDWIRAFLHKGAAAVLAAVRDGRPTCLPRLYVFDRDRSALYFHGAHGGEIGTLLEADSGHGVPVAVTVYEMGRLLPADEALEFGVEYASVIVRGRGHLVTDPEEAEHGLRLLMEKYASHLEYGTAYAPIEPEGLERTAVHRVDIEIWSGKEKSAPPEAFGAYRFEEVRDEGGSGS